MRLISILLAIGLALPMAAVTWVSFSPDGFLSPPYSVWSTRWYRAFPGETRWVEALSQSIVVAVAATLLSLVAGVPLAVAIVRTGWRGRGLVRIIALVPLGVPTVAVAAGWLALTTRLGLAPGFIPLAIAHAALGLPVVMLIVSGHLQMLDPRLTWAARSLGARPWQVFTRITLPLVMPGIMAAAAACFVLSVNEAVVSVFLSAPGAETLPAVVWPSLRQGPTPFVAVAAVVSSVLGLLLALAGIRQVRPQRGG